MRSEEAVKILSSLESTYVYDGDTPEGLALHFAISTISTAQKLAEALEGLKQKRCFCDLPKDIGHSAECIQAQQALEEYQKGRKG